MRKSRSTMRRGTEGKKMSERDERREGGIGRLRKKNWIRVNARSVLRF